MLLRNARAQRTVKLCRTSRLQALLAFRLLSRRDGEQDLPHLQLPSAVPLKCVFAVRPHIASSGAMENKSLNIFNSRLVLATPDTATDGDFARIEGEACSASLVALLGLCSPAGNGQKG